MSFLKEFVAFLIARKKLWLLPILIILASMGTLLLVAQALGITPFIYTLF